ncbi:extracellular solute-binding protein [Amphibacillus cookii]|uniref:extracellular solute-binding protein n=1 Tax=Amphibacillus cookii TaxID=767787 RepID=UPI00195631C5|nr:extracellular solute-binding protein [Amphibacillus cookii]MBM7541233.1 putative aldouronate transport system substrate-binding protein [Amphibacillus cookii]
MNIKKDVIYFVLLISLFSLLGCVGESEPEHNEDGQLIVKLGKQTATNPKLPEGDTFEDNAYTRLAEEVLDIELVNEFEANGEDYDRQVALAISSGELPDMMQVSQEEFEELYENDLIADLTDVFEEHASDYIQGLYDSYDINPLEDTTFEGHIYGLPAAVNVTPPHMIWIRQDWIDQLQLDFDVDGDKLITIEELESLALTFIEEDPGNTGNPVGIPLAHWLNEPGYGGAFTMTTIGSIFGSYPRNWIESTDGNITNGSLMPETKEALAQVKDWFDRGILDPQFGTRSWDDIMALAVNGQTGIVTGAWHMPDWGLSNVKEMHPDVVFEAYTLVDDQHKVNIASQSPSGSIAVVRKDFSNPEILIKLINLFYDTLKNEPNLEEVYPDIYQYQVLDVDGAVRPLNMEILGSTSELEHYAEISDALNGDIEVSDIPDARNQSIALSIMEYSDNPEDASTAAWALYHSRMKGLKLGQYLIDHDHFEWVHPVFFGTTPAIEQYYGNLLSMEEEEFIKIVTGVESIDHFDTFVEMWHSQGGDEILAEIEAEIAE